jgi:hybrid cluster-associated redox disulfide protein
MDRGMDEVSIPETMTAEELQQRWPATIRVLIRRRMACVGCPMARFDSVRDLALNYGIPLEDLRLELAQAAAQAPAEG